MAHKYARRFEGGGAYCGAAIRGRGHARRFERPKKKKNNSKKSRRKREKDIERAIEFQARTKHTESAHSSHGHHQNDPPAREQSSSRSSSSSSASAISRPGARRANSSSKGGNPPPGNSVGSFSKKSNPPPENWVGPSPKGGNPPVKNHAGSLSTGGHPSTGKKRGPSPNNALPEGPVENFTSALDSCKEEIEKAKRLRAERERRSASSILIGPKFDFPKPRQFLSLRVAMERFRDLIWEKNNRRTLFEIHKNCRQIATSCKQEVLVINQKIFQKSNPMLRTYSSFWLEAKFLLAVDRLLTLGWHRYPAIRMARQKSLSPLQDSPTHNPWRYSRELCRLFSQMGLVSLSYPELTGQAQCLPTWSSTRAQPLTSGRCLHLPIAPLQKNQWSRTIPTSICC